MIDTQLLALLLIPLAGGLLLAVFGSRAWAAELNALMSFGTFVASVVLTMRVIDSGSAGRIQRRVLHRPVQRLPGRADGIRRLHHLAVLTALHAHRAASR